MVLFSCSKTTMGRSKLKLSLDKRSYYQRRKRTPTLCGQTPKKKRLKLSSPAPTPIKTPIKTPVQMPTRKRYTPHKKKEKKSSTPQTLKKGRKLFECSYEFSADDDDWVDVSTSTYTTQKFPKVKRYDNDSVKP